LSLANSFIAITPPIEDIWLRMSWSSLN